MKCADCCCQIFDSEHPYGRCGWESRSPDDIPPCEEEDYKEEEV